MNARRAVFAASVALISMVCAQSAHAYSQLIVFGDSLSDNGNFSQKFGGALPAPAVYSQGRFTSGAVAVEVMSNKLGIPLVDYAYGGALSGTDNQFQSVNPLVANTGLKSQVANFTSNLAGSGQSADASALYVVWGGGNDFLSVIPTGNFSNIGAVVTTAVTNLVTEVGSLYASGARDFLVHLLPDLGTTFYGTSGAVPPALLNNLTASFNGALSAQLNVLKSASPGLNLTIFDVPTFLAGVRTDMAVAGANVTDRCWTGDYAGADGTLCANPDQYYLFDKVHPTAFVHAAVGNAFAAAVPEPATQGLMLVGLILGGLAMRRNRAA